LLDPPQQENGADEGEEDAEEERSQIDSDVGKARSIQIYEAKGATEVGERKKFRKVADQFRQSIEGCEGPGENKDWQQKKDGELDGLRLGAGKSGDEESQA
jgi:hypothetical protein